MSLLLTLMFHSQGTLYLLALPTDFPKTKLASVLSFSTSILCAQLTSCGRSTRSGVELALD